MKKKDANFSTAKEHIDGIHYAKSTEMKDLFIEEAGKIWDTWSDNNAVFWNSYCINGWDCWSLCDFVRIPLCTPSQQTQESWQKFRSATTAGKEPGLTPMSRILIVISY